MAINTPTGGERQALPTATAEALPEAMELAHRVGDGIEVRLSWLPVKNTVQVELNDLSTDETHVVVPRNEQALDAFYHPWAYVNAA